MKNKPITQIAFACLALITGAGIGTHAYGAEKQCPDFLDTKFKRLHAQDQVDLCALAATKPLLVINTASHCGFTKQFEDLERLHKKYRDRGLTVVGFASNSFNQAAKNEAEAATVCYKNFGVTFTMIAPTDVKGDNANSVFAFLAEQSAAPKWNFNKYLITYDAQKGTQVTRFDSRVSPMASELEEKIKLSL